MEVNFRLPVQWQNSLESWNIHVSNHRILGNLVITSEDEDARREFMFDLVRLMNEKLPPFSTLFINLNPKFNYSGDFFSKELAYGSPEFSVPYYQVAGDPEPDIFNQYFASILNFHPELQFVSWNVHDQCKKKGFPPSILQFLELMRNHLQENTYDEELNASLLRNIAEVEDLFKKDNVLEKTFRLPHSFPEWVSHWQEKKSIYLDLSHSDTRTQQMLVAGIFYNLLKTTSFRSPRNYWHLSGVVMINDASTVFAPVPWDGYQARYEENKEYWDDLRHECYILTKEQWLDIYRDKDFFFKTKLEDYYSRLITNELRLRNISVFTGTHDLKGIHDFIPQLSQVQIVPNL